MAEPKFSVSEITTFHQTFDEDLANYREAGVDGIGVWEFKLPEGDDAETLAKLRDSGLKATTCIPGTLSIWPVPFPGPTDPKERTQGLCDAIRRFAPFEPEVILCLTGHPGDTDPGEARRIVVDGLRQAAKVAGEHGLTLGLEPLHRNVYDTWTMIGDIPGTIELMDEIGEPNVKLLYDVYHLWDTDNVLEETVRHGTASSRASTSATGAPTPATTSTAPCRVTGSWIYPPSSARSRQAVWSTGSTSRSSPTTAPSQTRISRTRSGSRIPSTSASEARRDSRRPGRRGRRREAHVPGAPVEASRSQRRHPSAEPGSAGREPKGARDVRLAGKVALVTGAAHERGIGRGIVLALAGEGCDVAINDVAFEEMGEELAGLPLYGPASDFVKSDVSQREQVDATRSSGWSTSSARSTSPARTRAWPTGSRGRRSRPSRSTASSAST